MSEWPVEPYSYYQSIYRREVEALRKKSNQPHLENKFINCFLQWWDKAFSFWEKEPNFRNEYPKKYLSEYLRKLPRRLRPRRYFRVMGRELSHSEFISIGRIRYGKSPDGRLTWWVARAVAQIILNPEFDVIRRDAAWQLIKESEWLPCKEIIADQTLTKKQKERFCEWAEYCNENIYRCVYRMDRANFTWAVKEWNDIEKLPIDTFFHNHHLLCFPSSIEWISAFSETDPSLFCELSSYLKHPLPVISLFDRSLAIIYKQNNVLKSLLELAQAIELNSEGKVEWSGKNLIPVLLNQVLDHTVDVVKLLHNSDYQTDSLQVDPMCLTIWEEILTRLKNRSDGVLHLNLFGIGLMHKLIRKKEKMHLIELEILTLLQNKFPSLMEITDWPLDYLANYHEECAMWHFFWTPDSLSQLRESDKFWLERWMQNTYFSAIYISKAPVSHSLAASVLVKTPNPYLSWQELWSHFDDIRESLFWHKSEDNKNLPWVCLWLGILVLSGWLQRENNQVFQKKMAEILWAEIWRVYLDGLHFERNEMVRLFLLIMKSHCANGVVWLKPMIDEWGTLVSLDNEVDFTGEVKIY